MNNSMQETQEITTRVDHIIGHQNIDYQTVTKIANWAFKKRDDAFNPNYFKWLYETAFGGKTFIISAYHGEEKVGQGVALCHEAFDAKSHATHECYQLVDFFILPQFRGIKTIRKMYSELSKALADKQACVITMPNRRSELLNRKYFGVEKLMDLDIRFVPTLPFGSRRVRYSASVGAHDTQLGEELLEKWSPVFAGSQVSWNAQTLLNRLTKPDTRYHLYLTDTALGISVKQKFNNMEFALICGFLPNGPGKIDDSDIKAICGYVSYRHRTPFVIYIGHHSDIKVPGFMIPDRFRPSLMRLQGNEKAQRLEFSRFELIDCDFV